MAAQKKTEKKEKTTYRVVSANTGAQICGPFTNKIEADREAKRLNREARTGQRADGGLINFEVVWACSACQAAPVRHPDYGFLHCPNCYEEDYSSGFHPEHVVRLAQEAAPELVEVDRKPKPILHEGVPQSYEVQTTGGVVVG